MAVNSSSVAEDMGPVMVCVDPGISGSVELALTATIASADGKAGEWTFQCV